MAQVTTYAKLLPFGAVAIIGLLYIDTSHFSEFNPSGMPLLQATAALAPLTMFAFLGLESATVPAGDVRDPERTIPRSTVLGITIAATLYVLGTIVVMGVLPRQELVHSLAPFSDAARAMWGRAGEIAISIAVILSSIGALNGWTLLMGQVPMAAARDGLFPPLFGKPVGAKRSGDRNRGLGRVGHPARSRSGCRVGRLLGVLQSGRRLEHDGSGHPLRLLRPGRQPCLGTRQRRRAFPRVTIVEIVAFVFAMFTLYGCGAEPVLYGLVLLLLGIPVFVWQRRRAGPDWLRDRLLMPPGDPPFQMDS